MGMHENVAEASISRKIKMVLSSFGSQDERSIEAHGWHGNAENSDFAIYLIVGFGNITFTN